MDVLLVYILLLARHVFLAGSLLTKPATRTSRIVEDPWRDSWNTSFPYLSLLEAATHPTHPWKPCAKSEQFFNNGRNICIEGRRVPDFYLLGAMKSGTTSLYHDLKFAGVHKAPVRKYRKEFHFFDRELDPFTPKELMPKKFLRFMENCSGLDAPNARRSVLADFTPGNLRLVPRPHEYVPRLNIAYDWDEDISMPWRLRYIYGDERASKIQFAILLREPLSQMQSAWYMFRAIGAPNYFAAPSFREALKPTIDGLESTPKQLTGWLWWSFYGRQIEYWTSQFPASQFLVIPMKHYTHGDKDAVCWELSKRLGFAIHCDSRGLPPSHIRNITHDPVNEDAGQDLRDKFDRLMAEEKKRLVRVLTKGHREGMSLSGFHGEVGNEEAVREWLDAGW